MAQAARERTMAEHTAGHRAAQMELLLESAARTGREEQLCGA
jgi:hypothetical protein